MKTKKSKTKKALVSIIVVTVNRKRDLRVCLQSLWSSDYEKIEIIVVDNGSVPPIASWFRRTLSPRNRVRLIRSKRNLGAAGGRNLGTKFAKGEYLLFIDDDAKADKAMISQLLKVLKSSLGVGIVQPKIYDMQSKNILQGIGCNISLITGRVSALGVRERDIGQYDEIKEISTVGCIWMVKKELLEKIGGYDEEFFIPYEDLDFSFRIRRFGFKIYFVSEALAWHRGIKSTFISPLLDYIGIRSRERAYRIARNKIIFMRKHAPLINFIFFILIILPVYSFIHSLILLSAKRMDLLKDYWKGIISGIRFAMFYNDRNYNPLYESNKTFF